MASAHRAQSSGPSRAQRRAEPRCAGKCGDKGVTRGVALSGVLPFADHEDDVLVEQGQAPGRDLFIAGVVLAVGADVAEGGGEVAGSGGEVAAEIDRFGTAFGLIPREPEEDDDTWWVILEPGDYMAFTEPWDSGRYDT
ncbi:hypothetical protein [Microbispora bryophytorum]|uniref:hypothetical protein n=1 Tax=Microbispora bryophytorum TaxID=1460882 RepID=UPI003F4D097D